MRVAQKFRDGHPDGDPGSKVFAFGLEATQPRDLIHILDLFIFGAGLRNTLIDPQGTIMVDESQHARVLEEFLKIYTTYHFVSPDTINYSFGEMYQVIEGGKAGMCRVGDWDVAKWDTQALNGDFVVGAWPKFFPDKRNGVVIGGMRGVAVPENSLHKDLAISFASFMLTQPAQQASLAIMGAAVRKDLDVTGLCRVSRLSPGRHGLCMPMTSPKAFIRSIRNSRRPITASCWKQSPGRRRTGRRSSPPRRRKCAC
jgi:ABC-type glycerol-3-phosphate transport system substrate-binding protein